MPITKEQRDQMLLALKADEEKAVTDFLKKYNDFLVEWKELLDAAKPPENGLVSEAYAGMSSLYNNVSAYKGNADNLGRKHGDQSSAPAV